MFMDIVNNDYYIYCIIFKICFLKKIIKGKWEMYVCSKYYLLKILIILFYI